ncbi:AAA family ATPase [Patescibacteria group bacterium]|nr:AAA family ATPase [Patescibacteria group bacterium]MBU2236009.1 AAA family ATPase [Patescibacteria group bacterium]
MENDPLYFFIALIVIVFIGLALWYGQQRQHEKKGTVLDKYSRDLTALSESGKLDPVIGRYKELKRVIQILSRRTKNNPVLIGPSGVGKTAIVEALANEIRSNNVPSSLKNKRVLALDLSGLVAGTKYRGEFEQRLKGIVDEIKSAERNIILFIDELQTLAEAGEATGAIDASDILKPALARGELQAVGATTEEEYKKYIKSDPTLERRFQPVVVNEPSINDTLMILKGIRSKYEEHHMVKITDESIEAAVDLADKYLKDRFFPDKAIDLMDEASAKVRLAAISNPEEIKGEKGPQVTAKDVEEVINEWTNELISYKPKGNNTKELI